MGGGNSYNETKEATDPVLEIGCILSFPETFEIYRKLLIDRPQLEEALLELLEAPPAPLPRKTGPPSPDEIALEALYDRPRGRRDMAEILRGTRSWREDALVRSRKGAPEAEVHRFQFEMVMAFPWIYYGSNLSYHDSQELKNAACSLVRSRLGIRQVESRSDGLHGWRDEWVQYEDGRVEHWTNRPEPPRK